jgi:DNA-binding NtrC family response regulator
MHETRALDDFAAGSGDAPMILVVDDEQVIREILADFLAMEGFRVRTAKDGQDALGELSRTRFDLVLSDLKMPIMGGIELLQAISTHAPNVVTIIMTGFGTVETAIDAMKRGAYDYIMKPFKMEEVVHTVRRGLERRKLQAENLRLKEALSLYKVSEAIANSCPRRAGRGLRRRGVRAARQRRGRVLRAPARDQP